MIAALTFPWKATTWAGFLISERRSRCTFNPTSGAWEPFIAPLGDADLKRLMVMPGPPMPFASLIIWPFGGKALLWANIGTTIPGDQVVAFRFDIAKNGNISESNPDDPPIWLDLSPAGLIVYPDGSIMKPAPSAPGMPPTVPGSIATP